LAAQVTVPELTNEVLRLPLRDRKGRPFCLGDSICPQFGQEKGKLLPLQQNSIRNTQIMWTVWRRALRASPPKAGRRIDASGAESDKL
jgi:hypothetical protein